MIKVNLLLLAFSLIASTVIMAQVENLKIENLGSQVNSKYDELGPYITPDGKKLFFVREDDPRNTLAPEHTQDIWYSKLGEDNNWGEAQHLGVPFNKSWYNTIFYQSADGNTRIIRGAYNKGSFQGSGYSVSHLLKDGWSEPQKVKIKNYDKYSKGKSSGICLGSDNKTMIFYTANSQKDIHDLYVSFLLKDESWSEPMSLGPDINTESTEMSPFLAADGITLYFSSDRTGGYGRNDIYMAKRLDDTWQKWSTPVNMGEGVNTDAWDAYYTIPASANYAYMVSYKNTGSGSDIVRLKLKEELKPQPVVLIKGKVLDAVTNLPLQASISYNILPADKQSGIASSHHATGDYQIIAPYGAFYSFKAEATGYYPISENIDLRQSNTYQEITKNLLLAPIKSGEPIRLNNVFFESGKYDLKEESFPELDYLVGLLNKNINMSISISGYTDNVGEDELNLKLSENRAKAVMNYIVSKGISSDRIISKGFGENKPISGNESEEGRRLNRRVEFTIQ